MCALVGFLSVHVAVVLDLVALGCNEWNSVEFRDDKVEFFTRGLFQQCDQHSCRYINPSMSECKTLVCTQTQSWHGYFWWW